MESPRSQGLVTPVQAYPFPGRALTLSYASHHIWRLQQQRSGMAALTGCLPSSQNRPLPPNSTSRSYHRRGTHLLPAAPTTRRACSSSLSAWDPLSESPSSKQEDTLSVELEPITSEEQFDTILAQARDRSKPIIVDWIAAWCRKCIYLKPKLEKLASEFQPDVKFYCVDVNTVPQTLVKRADVTVCDVS